MPRSILTACLASLKLLTVGDQFAQTNLFELQWLPFIVITMGHYLFGNNNQMITVTRADGTLTSTSILSIILYFRTGFCVCNLGYSIILKLSILEKHTFSES